MMVYTTHMKRLSLLFLMIPVCVLGLVTFAFAEEATRGTSPERPVASTMVRSPLRSPAITNSDKDATEKLHSDSEVKRVFELEIKQEVLKKEKTATQVDKVFKELVLAN